MRPRLIGQPVEAPFQRRVRRWVRPSMPRSVSQVRASRAKAIVMLISSKTFDLVSVWPGARSVLGGRLDCFGVAFYISVGSARYSVTRITALEKTATRMRHESRLTHPPAWFAAGSEAFAVVASQFLHVLVDASDQLSLCRDGVDEICC